MQPDYRELLRVLEHREPGRPVLFEPSIGRDLCEQLLWRRGEGLWQEPSERLKSIVGTAKIAGLDCAASDPVPLLLPGDGPPRWQEDFPLLGRLAEYLPAGMGLACGCYLDPWSLAGEIAAQGQRPGAALPRKQAGSGCGRVQTAGSPPPSALFREVWERLLDYYRRLSGCGGVSVLFCRAEAGGARGAGDVRNWLDAVAAIAHAGGKPLVCLCGGSAQAAAPIAVEAGADGLHLPGDGMQPVEWFCREFGEKTAVLGGMGVRFMQEASPAAIRARCGELAAYTQNRGYALGTGNDSFAPIPYVNYIAMLGWYESNRDYFQCGQGSRKEG